MKAGGGGIRWRGRDMRSPDARARVPPLGAPRCGTDEQARSDATRRGRRGYFARRARSDAGPVRTLGPFGRPAPRAVLSRFRALRVDRPEDSDIAEAESCGERPGRFPGDPRMFFAPCRWGSGGNRDRLPPSKERDKSVLTVREGKLYRVREFPVQRREVRP